MPSHGDFLRRRVSDAFVDAWDDWLQRCMAASRSALGERWLDVYLTSPAWRFACARATCGPAPVIGVMAPSVDRVGRYFPLTIVSELPETASLLAVATGAQAFFDSAERLVIETLADEQVDFEGFDARLVALRDELGPLALSPRVMLDAGAGAVVNEPASDCWQLPIGSPDQLALVFEQLLSMRLSTLYEPFALWWTEGSASVDASCLITKGLPHPESFAALLDGSWDERRWSSVPAQIDPGLNDTLLGALGPPPLRFQSAAGTDVGKSRNINQDAFLERPEAGLWAVADGLGGHRNGEVASRMVCDALADFEPNTSFEEMVDAARQRIHEVNDHLLRASTRARLADRSGSTVVLLLARGTNCAILWAGDSRVYRWRAGSFERLTRDHSLAESQGGAAPHEAHFVTRAVGVESKLALDLRRDEVRAGDRFLLCSDGLSHTLADDQIGAWMENADIRAAVDGLIGDTLDAGAPDNVTVLIVEACA